MKEDFLEKIIPIENEEKRILINNMSKLLDESIDDFINLRERQKKDKRRQKGGFFPPFCQFGMINRCI